MLQKNNPANHSRLYLYWQAEAIRQCETSRGALNDSLANQAVINNYDGLDNRILNRAAILAQENNFNRHLDNWLSGARLAIIILLIIGFISGIGAALTSLASSQINLASALITILGLHFITFIVWLLSYLPTSQNNTYLAKLWFWLTRRIANNPDSTLAAQAFFTLSIRLKTWKSLLGSISHFFWLSLLSGASLGLLWLFSTKQYTFHWETTILSVDAFVSLTRILGSIPQTLGFPIPDTSSISAALANQLALPEFQSEWSLWLLGCIIVWGLLPRLVALLLCLTSLYFKLKSISIDTNLPGWIELRETLLPTHNIIGIDKPATSDSFSQTPATGINCNNRKIAIMGHELRPETNWPLAGLPTNIINLGSIASRFERRNIRPYLYKYSDFYLLLVCDGSLTPDRGTMAWLTEIRASINNIRILCLPGDKLAAWQKILASNGFVMADSVSGWLNDICSPANHE